MAIACLRLVTRRPEPLVRVPFLRRRIADSTFLDADFPYFAMLTSASCHARRVLNDRVLYSARLHEPRRPHLPVRRLPASHRDRALHPPAAGDRLALGHRHWRRDRSVGIHRRREELADLYLEEGQFARAPELYDSVITPRLDSLDPYYRRGIAELELGDVPAAILDLERVVAADSKYDFHRAIGLLAHAHSLAGDPERADSLFIAATTISTLSETYYNYALFLSTRQRTSEAREWAQRILAKKPTMPRYLQRRERPWFRKAKALLKRLPAATAG